MERPTFLTAAGLFRTYCTVIDLIRWGWGGGRNDQSAQQGIVLEELAVRITNYELSLCQSENMSNRDKETLVASRIIAIKKNLD